MRCRTPLEAATELMIVGCVACEGERSSGLPVCLDANLDISLLVSRSQIHVVIWRIELTGWLRGGRAVLEVRDHGPGISGNAARRLFQPFCKSAHEAANSAPGVGLGLALSRKLARHMGGDLQLDSGYGDGAGFVITLPLVEG